MKKCLQEPKNEINAKKIDQEREGEMNEEPLLPYILHFKGLCRF